MLVGSAGVNPKSFLGGPRAFALTSDPTFSFTPADDGTYVVFLTVTDSQEAYARQVHQQFLQAGVRSELDLRNEKLGYKVREAEVQKVPYMIVIGDKEVSTATVAPRGRKGEKIPPLTVAEFIARLAAERVPGGAP